MITRICVVDPKPDPKRDTDVLVYQVPEKSREFALLVELFEKEGLVWAEVPSDRRKTSKQTP